MKRFEFFNDSIKCPFCHRICIMVAIPEIPPKLFRLYAMVTITEIKETPIARDDWIDNIEVLKLYQGRSSIGVPLDYNHRRTARRLKLNAKSKIHFAQGKTGIDS
ncbi:hypothetical protein [Pandoraea sp. ISTKB]|uniref:hypothetical protein n=1 Tax=Pandoraea sp. ISTKB TaxID=1586708 RepID=UPI0008467721|nr:hypothetical protein [Pandoraea sp. ISTKB]